MPLPAFTQIEDDLLKSKKLSAVAYTAARDGVRRGTRQEQRVDFCDNLLPSPHGRYSYNLSRLPISGLADEMDALRKLRIRPLKSREPRSRNEALWGVAHE